MIGKVTDALAGATASCRNAAMHERADAAVGWTPEVIRLTALRLRPAYGRRSARARGRRDEGGVLPVWPQAVFGFLRSNCIRKRDCNTTTGRCGQPEGVDFTGREPGYRYLPSERQLDRGRPTSEILAQTPSPSASSVCRPNTGVDKDIAFRIWIK